jgi:ApaG protein
MSPYNCTTRLIKITADPVFLDAESHPEDDYYVWAYTIVIENTGDEIVQLMNRHWMITDAFGRVQEVRGPGVVGEQPILQPGDSFEYTSGTPLSTTTGIMVGSYEMKTNSGEKFKVEVPAFSLDCPYAVHNVH